MPIRCHTLSLIRIERLFAFLAFRSSGYKQGAVQLRSAAWNSLCGGYASSVPAVFLRDGGNGSYQWQRAHFDGSLASAFLTSDWETPNCRAIRDGLTPALKAARTAFNFPRAKGGATSLVRCLREGSSDTESFLPPLACRSASAAATNRSS